MQNIYTYRQGEKLCVEILRLTLFFGANYKSDKEILVRFDQTCSRIFPLNDSTYYLAIQLKSVH